MNDLAIGRWDNRPWSGFAPCGGLAPHSGYTLLDNSTPGINAPVMYVVRGPEGDAILHASPYQTNFMPSQGRWEWLVDNGFRRPPGTRNNLFSREIEAAIEAEKLNGERNDRYPYRTA